MTPTVESLSADVAELRAMISSLLALHNVQAPTRPAKDPIPEMYPKLAVHRGVTYMLRAPLPPDFIPSMEARTFGGRPGTYIADPSDAPEGMATRSPAGWPLVYGNAGVGYPTNGLTTFVAGDAAVAEWYDLMRRLNPEWLRQVMGG